MPLQQQKHTSMTAKQIRQRKRENKGYKLSNQRKQKLQGNKTQLKGIKKITREVQPVAKHKRQITNKINEEVTRLGLI